ncbi:hypothetical protein NCAS_0F03640 [Naumovozyma castellii]|uniref:Uncharacterized protein n=1 Tax=Naumovozyma castellii TaxID=27288 RepID=G0VH75_NAUCA|nr:hypothetical protein NCAS_0F03640 [Naumovozyma castellii CBS 4309]CCC70848.1 hypothetical protein NCAS_0F03640 [Naumovozyma castellii CBS 4309]
MLSYLSSPATFATLPVFQNNFLPDNLDEPQMKRRKGNQHQTFIPRRKSKRQADPSKELKYSVAKTNSGYILSILKSVPKRILSREIHKQLLELREQYYRPVYQIVEDFAGNQLYMEETPDEDALLESVLPHLNMSLIRKRITRELFQDYELELNHRGDEINVRSARDNISKDFELDAVFDDAKLLGFNMIENNEFAVMKIELLERSKSVRNIEVQFDSARSFAKTQASYVSMIQHTPLLEEIPDEEVERYQTLLAADDPSSTSIINDI